MLPVVVGLVLGLIRSVQADPEIININDKEEYELYLETKEYIVKEYIISVPPTYKLFIKVEELTTFSENGEYILIKSGPDIGTEGTGLVLTEKAITKHPIVISSSKIYIKFNLAKPKEGKTDEEKLPVRKFKLKYKAYGSEKITTTETPIPSTTFPTPGPNDVIHYKTELYGLKGEDYLNSVILNKLRTAISMMATAYCKDQGMQLDKLVTKDNVQIDDLLRCPITWPENDKCVIINFAVPVVIKEDYYQGYQLLGKHLKMMWERYFNILEEAGFHKFEAPDLEIELVYWDWTIALVLSFFILGIIGIALLMIYKPICLYRLFGKVRKEETEHVRIHTKEVIATVPNESEFTKFKTNNIT